MDIPPPELAAEPFVIMQRIPLRFDLPLPLARRKSQAPVALSHARDPFQQALAELRWFNHTPVSADKRFRDVERFAQSLWPHVTEHLHTLAHERGRVRLLTRTRWELFERLLCALISAYQLVFAADYADARDTERLKQTGLRLLEWIRTLQRLSALRYRPLSANAWQTANTTFFALASLAATADPLPALSNTVTTAQTVYLSLQSFALFDVYSWPRRQQEFIDCYAQSIAGVRVLARIEGGAERRFVHAYHDGPPALAPPCAGIPCAMLDFRALAAAIRADRRIVTAGSATADADLPARLRPLPPAQRRSLLRLLERDLDIVYSTDEPRANPTATQAVQLKIGLVEVRAHLRRIFARAVSTLATAVQESPIADAETWQPVWRIVDCGPRHLRVKARFVSDTGPLAIGLPVAYGLGADGLTRPMLGRVARLLHTDTGVLVVDLATLARFALPVRLHSADSPAPLPALLVYDDDFGWGVLVAPQERLHEGNGVELRTKRRTLHTRLRRLREASAEFLLFQTDAQGLGEPSYPAERSSAAPRTAEQRTSAAADNSASPS